MRGAKSRLNDVAELFAGALALGVPGLALAQAAPAPAEAASAPAADSGQVERVVVTAERRATILDTTPAALTALSGSKLAEQGQTGLADVATFVPNTSFTTGQGTAQLFVRGIGNVFILAGGDPGVAMYADGAYVSDQTSSNVALFDTQRIEVLRGPQGALYGRNATGGAVNLISAAPTDSFSARVGVLVGDYGRKESEGFVSGPLSEGGGTRYRVSYQVKGLDGYTGNPLAGTVSGPVIAPGDTTVGPKKLDDLSSRALRLQTASDVGGGSLRVILGHYRERDAGASMPLLVEPAMIPTLLFGAVPSSDPRVVKSQGSANRTEVNSVLAGYEHPLGANTLSLTASWRGSHAAHAFDSDGTESPTTTSSFATHSSDTSVDLHLSSEDGVPLQWLVGATVLQFDQTQDVRVSAMVPLGFLVPGQPLNVPVPVDFLLGGTVRTRSAAAYVDLRYALSEKLALLGGLRASRDRKHSDEYLNVATFGLNGAQPLQASWNSTPGSLGVEYKFAAQTLGYARLSHGFKSGAVNLGALQPSMVRPETVTAFELGFKTDFLDRRATFAAAAFTSRYKDMQVSQVGQATVQLTNASKARIDGAELELVARPTTQLTLTAAIGLMDPKYTDFTNTDLRNNPTTPVNVKGNQLAQVARSQLSVGAEYGFAVGAYKAQLRADYEWKDKVYFTEFNTPDAQQPAYGLLNVAASIRPENGRWKLYGWVKNAGNTTAITSMSISSPVLGAARQVTYTPPRMVGVGATLDF